MLLQFAVTPPRLERFINTRAPGEPACVLWVQIATLQNSQLLLEHLIFLGFRINTAKSILIPTKTVSRFNPRLGIIQSLPFSETYKNIPELPSTVSHRVPGLFQNMPEAARFDGIRFSSHPIRSLEYERVSTLSLSPICHKHPCTNLHKLHCTPGDTQHFFNRVSRWALFIQKSSQD